VAIGSRVVEAMPVSGAAAAIFDERGRVLLVKENYGRRRYGFPGGAREARETLSGTSYAKPVRRRAHESPWTT
jgi:8-oxo-dGTP pyrophosphatase MutT (NUDIX family)